MYKLIVASTFLSIFLFCCSRQPAADDHTIDSLKKYSYVVFGIKSVDGVLKGKPIATGFFIRVDTGLIFCTAKHVVSEMNTFTKKPVGIDFDSIGIRYFKKSNNAIDYIYFSTTELKSGIANKYFYESPEVIFIKIPDRTDAKINSLEKLFFGYKPNDKEPDSVYIYGFAGKSEKALTSFDTLPMIQFVGHFADLKHSDPFYPANDSLNIVLQPGTQQGMSGAPVFFKYSNSISFGGVQFGYDSIFNSTFIVRPSVTVNEYFSPTILR